MISLPRSKSIKRDKSRFNTLMLMLILSFITTVEAASIVRGPYVQLGTQNSMTIRWDTDTATTSKVSFGAAVNALNTDQTDTTAKTKHIVKLTGLTPLTRYYYSIGTVEAVLAGNDNTTFFETSPTPGQATSTRIWVVGDPGRAGTNPTTQDQQYVLNGFKTFNNDRYTDFWLMLGDNAYNDGTIQEYQNAVFNQYPDLLKQSPLWPAMGNHDSRTAKVETQTGGYYDLFSTPTNGEAGGEPSNHKGYYSFDYGDIHVVVLNSADSEHNQLSGPMDEWLENDLSQSNAQWLISIFHHAPYGKSGHDSDIESGLIRMRENFLPILEKHGVDLVMAGHNHFYTRTRLMSNHYGDSTTFNGATHNLNMGDGQVASDGAYTKQARKPNSGTVYITHGAGSGGGNSSASKVTQAQIDNGDRHPSDYVYGGRGSMVLDIDGDDMKVNVISPVGAVIDHFTIRHLDKTVNQAPTANIDAPATGLSNTAIAFSGANSTDIDGTIAHYLWDFGDDNTSNLANPSHSYATSGTYNLQLTVTDNGGLTNTTNASITISSLSTELTNGNTIMIAGEKGQSTHYTMDIPLGAKDLVLSLLGGSGDADLYVRFGQQPTKTEYDCRPYKGGNKETCTMEPTQKGTYHIMIFGFDNYADVALVGNYTATIPSGPTLPDACATQAPYTERRLTAGEPQCLDNNDRILFSIGDVENHQSIAITTGHGDGNLDIQFSNQSWPNGDNVDASSAGSDNTECVWLNNLDEYWGYLEISGSNGTATIVVDFDSDTCRLIEVE